MSDEPQDPPVPRIDSLDRESLEGRLREAARVLAPNHMVDDLEVQHLVRVITECSLLLRDVYSDRRIERIMRPERGVLSSLVDRLVRHRRDDETDVLTRVRRLPQEVRLVGDKALFDLGLRGQRRVKGYDLEDLGARAYRVAGEVLELLADDPRLRKFYEQNRLHTVPLEEEVVFLRQCSEKFRLYADILKGSQQQPSFPDLRDLAEGVALTGAEHALVSEPIHLSDDDADEYLDAARGDGKSDESDRRQQISSYERILLFSALDLDRVIEALDRTVIDQPEAVRTLRDEIGLFAAGTHDPRKPPAFFLVGPTGVGKNHLIESLVRLLEGVWHAEVPMLTIEGPNYTYPSDINELRGATRGFIRSDEEGLLTSFHARSSEAPVSVILIDEVEKAHPQLLTFFLSILDRGTTTDNRGDVLNFANCILFFTSNVGYSAAQQRSAPIGYMGDAERTEAADSDVRQELRRHLRPEFVNRVRMVHFNRLTRGSAERILDLEFDRIAQRYAELHGLTIELAPSARAELIQRGFSEVYGARHLAAALESICNVAIARKIRQDDRRTELGTGKLVGWLRELRAGRRAYQADEVRRRVMDLAGARLDYDTLRVVFEDGEFDYRAEPRSEER